jgi:hypothetical protein
MHLSDGEVRERARQLAESQGLTVYNVHKIGHSWRMNGEVAEGRPFFVGWVVGKERFIEAVARFIEERENDA